MKQYTRKLLQHRANVVGRVLVCIFIIVALCFGVVQYHKNRSYESYEVISSMDHQDAINTRYEEYGDHLLKYSKDGITCMNLNHEPVWSQPFSIQDPIVSICGPSAVLADRGGNQVYIFNESGLTGQVDTLLPVQQVTVSRQGVTAILLEDSSVTWIYLYDAEGTKLLDVQCSLADTGQPLSISLSHDGSKLAVSYLQISGGTANSCVVFYNLGSVGDNFVDKIVASRFYEGILVPRVKYLDGDTCVAIGENGFSIYEGAEIPEEVEISEEVRNVGAETEIRSVCFGNREFGLVFEQEGELPYLLRVYDERGGIVLEKAFAMKYAQVKLSGDNVIVYNDTECAIYSKGGVLRYEGTFPEALVNVYSLQGRRFVIVHPQRTDVIKLN